MEDAIKKRRDYLRTFVGVYAKCALAVVACICFIVGCFYGCNYFIDRQLDIQDKSIIWLAIRSLVEFVGATIFAVGLLAAWVGIAILGSVKQDAEAIPYVPPVHEQIAALPAEDILLRGSDHLEALPGELLRAAQAGTETASEELLRAQQTAVEAELRTL